VVGEEIGSVPSPSGGQVRGVERALVRAQELVDGEAIGQRAVSRYSEAMHVGDLSVLALLLQRGDGAGRALEV
jgi:hypothetical protein